MKSSKALFKYLKVKLIVHPLITIDLNGLDIGKYRFAPEGNLSPGRLIHITLDMVSEKWEKVRIFCFGAIGKKLRWRNRWNMQWKQTKDGLKICQVAIGIPDAMIPALFSTKWKSPAEVMTHYPPAEKNGSCQMKTAAMGRNWLFNLIQQL